MYSPPPTLLVTPQVISIISPWSAFYSPISDAAASPASSTGNAANEALYAPFVVTTPATFTRGFWWNGSAAINAGQVAVGIYDEAQARLATTGAVTAAGNSVIQSAAFTASVYLGPGIYYMAIEFSASGLNSTTAYTAGLPKGARAGWYRQAVGAHPLPATAVFATWATQVIPVFGVTTTSFAI